MEAGEPGATRVKLFVATLAQDDTLLPEVREALAARWGPVDWESEPVPFDVTDYYREEFGPDLERRFFSFGNLIEPEQLPEVKRHCMEVEKALAREGKRRVNLDPGYLDYHKAVLASTKFNGPKIALVDGIYADLVLLYSGGIFRPLEWSFPDFKTGRYDSAFLELRRRLKQDLRRARSGHHAY